MAELIQPTDSTNPQTGVTFDQASAQRIANVVRLYERGLRYTGPPARPKTLKSTQEGQWVKITAAGANNGKRTYSWQALDPSSGSWEGNDDLGKGDFDKPGYAYEITGAATVSVGSFQFLFPTPGQDFYTFRDDNSTGYQIAKVTTEIQARPATDNEFPGNGFVDMYTIDLSNGQYKAIDGATDIPVYNNFLEAIAIGAFIHVANISGTYMVINACCEDIPGS